MTLSDIDAGLAGVREQLELVAEKLYPEVEGLAQLIFDAILEGAQYDANLNDLEALVTEAYQEGWHHMADWQKEILNEGSEIDESLDDYASIVSAAHGGLVTRSLVSQVTRAIATGAVAMAVSYVALTVNETVTGAGKDATDALATYYSPTHKQFARIRAVKEPRIEHSILEGQIIAVDDYWELGGYLVLAPRDPELPPSQRFNCQHANVYLNIPAGSPLLAQVAKRRYISQEAATYQNNFLDGLRQGFEGIYSNQLRSTRHGIS